MRFVQQNILFCYFIVMMVLFVNVCCSGHRNSKRFLIGNSLEQKLTVEEMLELYLQALCKGDKQVLCMLFPEDILDFCIRIPNADCFAPIPEACRLELKAMDNICSDECPNFSILLHLKEDKDEFYHCYITCIDGRLYVSAPLAACNRPVTGDFQ